MKAEKKTYKFSDVELHHEIIPALKGVGLKPNVDKVKDTYGYHYNIEVGDVSIYFESCGGGTRSYPSYKSFRVSNPEGDYWYKGKSRGDSASDHRFYIKFGKEVTGHWLKSNIERIVKNYKDRQDREKKREADEKKSKKTAQAIRDALKENGIIGYSVDSNYHGAISIDGDEYDIYLSTGNDKVHSFKLREKTFYDEDEFRVYTARLIRMQDFINKLNKILKEI
jgi:hypothetical protein